MNEFIDDYILSHYRTLCRIVKQTNRICRYIPVLYKTHSWDHACCLLIYQHSLKDLKYTILNGYNANGKQLAHKVDIMINLIDRIVNEWETYNEHRWHLLEQEFGKSSRFTFEINPVNGRRMFQCEETNEKRKGKDFSKRFRQYSKEEDYLRQQDLKILGDMIAKWSNRLWD